MIKFSQIDENIHLQRAKEHEQAAVELFQKAAKCTDHMKDVYEQHGKEQNKKAAAIRKKHNL